MRKVNASGSIPFENKYSFFLLPLVLVCVDYFAVWCAEWAAFSLRNFLIPSPVLRISWLSSHVIGPAVFLLFMQISSLYTRRMQFWRTMAAIFRVTVYAMVTLILLMYVWEVAGSTSRLFTGFMAIFSFCFLVAFRYVAKKIFEHFGILQIPVLVLGAGKTAALVLGNLKSDAGLGYDFIGYLEDNTPEEPVASMMPCLGGFCDAEKIIQETGVRHVLVIAPGLHNDGIQDIIYRLQPLVKTISFIPDMGRVPLATLDMESLIDGHIVAFSVRNNLAHWYNRWVKRVFDIVCTTLGLIALSPLFLVIALWIYRDSPGPVIFKHRRIGKNGKSFDCYKFRSMVMDADKKLEELLEKDPAIRAEWEKDFKLKDDPRITKSGAFLRKTSLDELPQLLNVLKGEMSLVGPRPIIRDEVERYGKWIADFYMVRPGVTGMWQTSGRSDVSYDERVQMDSWYVRNWSVWFDIVLICRTVGVVLGKRGAY